MTALKKFLLACTAGVVLLLVVVFAERYFLNRAEARGRKSGAAVQQAVDVMRADQTADSLATVMQARLDSVQRTKDSAESTADGTFADVQIKYRDRIVHDTVTKEIIAAAKADVQACKDGRAQCEVRAETAERDAARAHLAITDRDTTILRLARATIPPPRSCIPQGVAGGLLGAAIAIVVRH